MWLGYDVLVMPGVKIGDGSIVATRSVVVSDVPAYSVVGGNPAKVIKQRFPNEVVNELLSLQWWDWPIEKITRNLTAIVGADIGPSGMQNKEANRNPSPSSLPWRFSPGIDVSRPSRQCIHPWRDGLIGRRTAEALLSDPNELGVSSE